MFLAKYDPDGNHLWSFRLGGLDTENPEAVTSDPSGNIVLTGSFDGTMDFGGGNLAGSDDVFVAKYDAGGNHLVTKAFGYRDCSAAISPGLVLGERSSRCPQMNQ
jgi:hypothetical protein